MKNIELREYIESLNPSAVLFDNPSFDNSIIGISTSGNIVYDLELMIEELANDDNITYDDAADFISYNTVRALPYITEGDKTIICDKNL